ncbi:MAG: hypothetical protein IIX23_03285 [Oscillospiraceae bacterium]|nr:hypothetical protein [Oscillospiraceae bacterium]
MNDSANRQSDKFGRMIIFILWGNGQLMAVFLAVAMLTESVFVDGWYMLLFISALWTCLAYTLLRSMPIVELKEDGIYCRVLVKTKFYNWRTIEQAGFLWSVGRYARFNDLVLLKPGGSKRKYKDKTFRLRNWGKLIHIKPTEGNIRFVCEYYGPLDFNLSDGRDETSVVMEESIFAHGDTKGDC